MNNVQKIEEFGPVAKRTLRDIVNTLLYVLDESGGEVTDELDAIELELEAKVEAYRCVMLQLDAEADANKALAAHYAAKAAARAKQVEALKARLLDGMQAAGTPKIKTATCTAYLQQSVSVEVADDFCEHAADRFVRVTSAPDKKAIKEALEVGSAVDGARLVSHTSLRFR